MNKHAYLIMAHNNWQILKKLLLLLDDEHNDIYLHIDKRVDSFDKNILSITKFSKIVMVNRIPVYWADFSQVTATYELLNSAAKNGDYSYFHLLSGADLPIKSKQYIYDFFENSGKEFIGIVPHESYYSIRHIKFYHPFLHNKYYRNSKLLKGADKIFEYIQKFCNVNRLKNNNQKIIDGWTWFSITNKFCKYVLNNEAKVKKMYHKTIASDEQFIQTLAFNSPFVDNIYDLQDLKNGSMRFIDWQRGKPYTWGADEGDFDLLMSSPYLFARKFDENNMEIIDKIFDCINRRNQHEQ